MNPTTRIAAALLFAAWCIDYIDRSVIGVALPAIGRDLGLGHGQLGLVVSVFFVAYALAQLPGGMLSDRFGAMRVAVAGLVAWSACTGLTAAAFSFGSLIAIRILFGVSQGIFPSAAMKLLAERSTPDERMTANGWVNSSNAVGVVLAMIIAAVLLPLIGWRGLFVAISVLGLLITVTFVRRMPAPLPDAVGGSPRPRRALELLKVPAMWLFALAFFGYDLMVWGTSAWFATYLQEQRGLGESSAALLGLPPGIAAAVMIVLAGRYSDRIGGRPRPLIVPGMIVAGVLTVALPFAPGLAGYIVVSVVAIACASPAYIGAFSMPLKQLDPAVSGIGAGMILMGGMVAGVVSPTVFGFIVDGAGWHAAWAFLAVGAAIAVLAALLAPRDAAAFRSRIPAHLLFTPDHSTSSTITGKA